MPLRSIQITSRPPRPPGWHLETERSRQKLSTNERDDELRETVTVAYHAIESYKNLLWGPHTVESEWEIPIDPMRNEPEIFVLPLYRPYRTLISTIRVHPATGAETIIHGIQPGYQGVVQSMVLEPEMIYRFTVTAGFDEHQVYPALNTAVSRLVAYMLETQGQQVGWNAILRSGAAEAINAFGGSASA